MIKMAFVAIVLTLLGACASIAPAQGSAAGDHRVASFDEMAAPVEPIAPVFAMGRRSFSPPSHRQPDVWPVLATTADRLRRHVRRRRANCNRAHESDVPADRGARS